jgi:hypothetical protein
MAPQDTHSRVIDGLTHRSSKLTNCCTASLLTEPEGLPARKCQISRFS